MVRRNGGNPRKLKKALAVLSAPAPLPGLPGSVEASSERQRALKMLDAAGERAFQRSPDSAMATLHANLTKRLAADDRLDARLASVGGMRTRARTLSEVPEGREGLTVADKASAERELMIGSLWSVLEFVRERGGSAADCSALIKLYEGLVRVHMGQHFYAFQPEAAKGRAGGLGETRAVKRAVIAAGVSALMRGGQSEGDALAIAEKEMALCDPDDFTEAPDRQISLKQIQGWRDALGKGRENWTKLPVVQERYRKLMQLIGQTEPRGADALRALAFALFGAAIDRDAGAITRGAQCD